MLIARFGDRLRPYVIPMPILPGVVALVDDDASILRALERCLAAYGYRVKAFTSAEQYLAEVKANEISCAVIDLELGAGLSGLELAEHISSSLLHKTPIVFMSGSDDPGLRERVTNFGCVAFLEKPFLVSGLIAALNSR